MEKKLLDILACPSCKQRLALVTLADREALHCRFDKLIFSIRDGIPVLVLEEATKLEIDEETAS